jgi:hypothetical protein
MTRASFKSASLPDIGHIAEEGSGRLKKGLEIAVKLGRQPTNPCIMFFSHIGFFLFCQATSAWFVVSPTKAFSTAQSRHEI